ncbi:uncharacterized protein A4U43_C07F36750 [Asparagus officinalis]|uniref:SS18 N-terminal domain-containing protein n=1 Tax=Asparagus officinalis TaxID=4686 RepID=A0A5P1EHZ8_ASPOF|nr:uncharacterized protein A4U43_C07F36750 [Asparagus officinalis]
MGSVPPAGITTEQIQKYLDENKQLILAILDNQNMGRLGECAQYQAQLQKNLLYLAAIADAQPQSPAMRPQMIPQAAMPQGAAQFHHPSMPFMGMRPIGAMNGMHAFMNTESSHGRGNNENSAADSHKNSEAEPSENPQRPEDSNL